MFFSTSHRSVSNWTGYTLLMPAVSVGNVGQLACDLLIHTLKLTKVGCLYDRTLQPLCGNDAFISSGVSTGQLVTSTEVYESVDKKIIVIQQRASVVPGRATEFRRKLLAWIKETGFSKVILLTSCYAYERTDAQILGDSYRYLITPTLEGRQDEFVSAITKCPRLEKKPAEPGLESPGKSEDIPEAARDLHLPGGGMAKRLFIDCCREDIPLAVLLLYCSEGDNSPDAMMMATLVNKLLHLLPEPANVQEGIPPWRVMWKVPSSWRLLFGRPVDPSIF